MKTRVLGASLGAVLALVVGVTAAGERVDFYDQKGRRAGYAIVDERTGRVDLYDAQSRRLGFGRVAPDGSADLYGPDGGRLDLRTKEPKR